MRNDGIFMLKTFIDELKPWFHTFAQCGLWKSEIHDNSTFTSAVPIFVEKSRFSQIGIISFTQLDVNNVDFIVYILNYKNRQMVLEGPFKIMDSLEQNPMPSVSYSKLNSDEASTFVVNSCKQLKTLVLELSSLIHGGKPCVFWPNYSSPNGKCHLSIMDNFVNLKASQIWNVYSKDIDTFQSQIGPNDLYIVDVIDGSYNDYTHEDVVICYIIDTQQKRPLYLTNKYADSIWPEKKPIINYIHEDLDSDDSGVGVDAYMESYEDEDYNTFHKNIIEQITY